MNEILLGQLLDLTVGAVLVMSFATLWLRRLLSVGRAIAVQGVALGSVALVLGLHEHDSELIIVAVSVTVLRGFVLPRLILQSVRAGGEHREIEPLINVPASLLTAALLTMVAYAATRNVVALADTPQVQAMPLGIAVALIGLLLIATRRKAVMQIIGVLMFDNGIALVMFLGTSGVPLAVEFGVAADVLLAIFILHVLTTRIRTKFGGTDVGQLQELCD